MLIYFRISLVISHFNKRDFQNLVFFIKNISSFARFLLNSLCNVDDSYSKPSGISSKMDK